MEPATFKAIVDKQDIQFKTQHKRKIKLMQILIKERIKLEYTLGFHKQFNHSSSNNADRMLLILLVGLSRERYPIKASHKVVTYLLNMLMKLESVSETASFPTRLSLPTLRMIMKSDSYLAFASVFTAFKSRSTEVLSVFCVNHNPGLLIQWYHI